jgi:DNA-binding LytR/AlgR family response regulator
MTLKTLMIKLDNPDFARCHRSFIVNIRHVKDMIKRENYRLVMENGEEIPVSEKNVGAMKKILNKKLLF